MKVGTPHAIMKPSDGQLRQSPYQQQNYNDRKQNYLVRPEGSVSSQFDQISSFNNPNAHPYAMN